MKMKNTYAVLGATGNIGRTLVRDLLKKGYAVRAVGRDTKKLAELKKLGAQTYATSFESVSELTKIFTGTTAVLTMLPPAYMERDVYAYQEKISESIASAIEESQVKYVVNISSIGAQFATGTGIIQPHYKNEQRLNKLGINVVHIRPPMFMENFFFATQEIESQGSVSWAYRKDYDMPFIATSDIAKKAFEFLEKLDFSRSSVFELYGPEALTFEQATSFLSKSFQKSVRYNQSSYSDVESAMQFFGFNANSARLMMEFSQALNEGRIVYTQPQTPQNTCTTTFSSFTKQYFSKKTKAA